ncbi:cysteine proteinase [Fragilariopsis cylindrus CCMP1102]|uniref:Ubiquitin carboxyl-terminal hydrolase n=1 Tax=Fragilariopsis cylindrus CCMP1102 TaxID=635003 RepID=A0A1E7FW19_9STRA|nr:cysteine proteinase [Fragilariopsis cylindrus CCMP1102]|eukprot:OEU22351.1 cysteine proteinase [Fragilariopsis cylindrus CCMP1102]
MSVQYCDKNCQESHWFFHRTHCKSQRVKLTAEGNTEQSVLHISLPPDSNGRVGLNNLGNTCFMNSALQSLQKCTPLTRYFLSNRFKSDLNTSNPLGTGGKLASAYEVFLKDVWMKSGMNKSISPVALKRSIALFAPRFAGCHQHDAQEFLAYLLDGLHEDLNRIRRAPYVEMPDVTDGQNMAIAAARAWDAHKRRNDSLVLDTFYGQFQSTCVCPRCNRVSMSFDTFNHISLEIPPNNLACTKEGVTLHQCFQSFSKPERLDVNNMWYCSKCSEHVQALKTMKLWKLPNILVVHLKRFEFKHALRRDKLGTFVDFPLTGLNMDPHCAGRKSDEGNNGFVDNNIPADYDLFAVVNHYGRMGFGHYTAFAMENDDDYNDYGKWNVFDDSIVSPIPSNEIPSSAAYILFYQRRVLI